MTGRSFTRRKALSLLAGSSVLAAAPQGVVRQPPARKPYVVLAAGETEYQSERTLPELAQELEARYSMRCSVLTANGKNDLPGLESLEDAAVAILYLRFLELPADQLQSIREYVGAGKPLVALRTTTHAFDNWKEFGQEVLGAGWQYHYGHESSTEVRHIREASGHPILAGVAPEFHCRSWLYHVLPLAGPCKPLLMGKSAGESKRPERVDNPVAWTTTYKGGRVFYTSLGHPEDFGLEPFRRLLINGIHWALDRPMPKA